NEAPSTGVFGVGGAGMAVDSKLSERIPIRIYTFGKAMGVHGACIAGSAQLREYLINFARPFIYTTAPDHHTMASIACAFEYLREHIDLQNDLRQKIMFFENEMSGHPAIDVKPGTIQTVHIQEPERVRQRALALQE